MASSKLEKIILIALSQIAIDETFNVRSSLDDAGGKEEDPNGMNGLIDSILTVGQDEPVVVRPNPKAKDREKQPYALTAGFRRFEAIKRIALKLDEKAPTIKAVVREMNESEAVAFNIRENTARENLSGPDLAFGVHAMSSFDPQADGTSIAKELGMTQPYISKLLRIMTKTDPKVAARWRKDPLKLSVNKMEEISKLDMAKQAEAYKALQLAGQKQPVDPADPTRGQNAWITSAKENAKAIGKMLGSLVRDKAIKVLEAETFFLSNLDTLLKVNKKASTDQREEIAAAAEVGFDEGLKHEEKAEKPVANATPAN